MKRIDEINGRGWADGWHAQQLKAQAERNGVTMAAQFLTNTAGASAFNVFGKAIKVTSALITYQFADGSQAAFVNQRGTK